MKRTYSLKIRLISLFLAKVILVQICFPTISWALSGGPSQPEVQSFEPVGTTEMVDLSSGDFTYNIPLLDVDGYPINISYHSGVTMDQEASWVGLGWNINPGVVNRNMRGLPDDFKGDKVKKDNYMKANTTIGLTYGIDMELFAKDLTKPKVFKYSLGASLGVYYNNYRGVGYEKSISPSISAGNKIKPRISLSISDNSQDGMGISPSFRIGYSSKTTNTDQTTFGFSMGVSANFNSRTGMKALSFSKALTVARFQEKRNANTNYGAGAASNGTSMLNYNSETFTPQITMPVTGVSINLCAKVGTTVNLLDPDHSFSGYFTSQYVGESNRTIEKGAFGYMYSEFATPDVLMDINREKDGSYSKVNSNLPVTNFSHDLYMVNGQGIGGMFRPYRSELGHVHDDEMNSNSYGGGSTGEWGVGNLTDWGFDFNFNYNFSKTGKWKSEHGNELAGAFEFKSKRMQGDSAYEPVYFKYAGEKNKIQNDLMQYKDIAYALRPSFYSAQSGNNANYEITGGSLRGDVLVRSDGNETSNRKFVTILNQARKKREVRNQPIEITVAADGHRCYNPEVIESYAINSTYPFNSNNITTIDRLDKTSNPIRKRNHITEIVSTNNQGVRYVYGIAAYNKKQEEVSFTNLKRTVQCSGGLADYSPDYYNKKHGEDESGYDAYYSATTLPAFAHSFLLTAVLSPEYLDKTNNGVTDDDYGNFTKINYSKVADEYKWRTPYAQNKANHSEGLKSDDYDGKGSFIYGTKEIWMVNSIESKNYIAEFKITRRSDGIGVLNVHGGRAGGDLSNDYMYLLQEIRLYSKADKIKNGSAAIPIKVVHFEYDYSLCQNVDNNKLNTSGSKGKLTLKKIYFTYGNSEKGALNSYEFTYNYNPDYSVNAYDRWGYYKPNNVNSVDEFGMPQPCNAEFPYATQSKTQADLTASAWLLTKIDLPSGGVIEVDYESDDYAFVQNKNAMQMYTVKGFSKDGEALPSDKNKLYDGTDERNWVHVIIPNGCESIDDFRKYFVPDQKDDGDKSHYLFFNFLTHLKLASSEREYVRGYAEVDFDASGNALVNKISNNEYAIKVKSVKSGDSDLTSYDPTASPFSKAAWQYFRLSLPQYIYPGSNTIKNPEPTMATIKALSGVLFEIYDLVNGINDRLLQSGYGSQVVIGNSWVRLKNANGFKYGGGSRVKRIKLSDNVESEMGNMPESTIYGQEYDYTTSENGRVISSGVAAYEPMIGNEENPFRQPIITKKEMALIPDESFYSEEPMGESFFPGATITYSKITTRNLSKTGVVKSATGRLVNEFYTTRDFPTLVERTNSQSYVTKPNFLEALLSLSTFNQVSAVQGYQIELNDMNGKPKAEWSYAENIKDPTKLGSLVTGKKYFYKTNPLNPNQLSNNVQVINSKGEIEDGPNVIVGVDADMVLDTRREVTESGSFGAQYNSDIFALGPAILMLFIPIPQYSKNITQFQSAVVTRVIQRYGLLEKVVAYADNSVITTENVAYDAITGEVLLTKTQNEYEDPIYNLTYPAHWVYRDIGPSYINADLTLSGNGNDYTATLNGLDGNPNHYIGDLFELRQQNTDNYSIFYDINNILRTSNSTPSSNDNELKVIRSGRANLSSLPVQTITSRKIPYKVVNGVKSVVQLDASNEILTTSVTEYQKWDKVFCDYKMDPFYDGDTFTKQQLIDVIDYLLKSSFLVKANTTNNTSVSYDGVHLQEYNKFKNSFLSKCVTEESESQTVLYEYNANISDSSVWLLNFNSAFNWKIKFKIPNANCFVNNSSMPTGISYVSDNLIYDGYRVKGNITVSMNVPNCSSPVQGVISLEGVDGKGVTIFPCGYEMCVIKDTPKREKKFWQKKRDWLYLDNRIPQDNLVTHIRKDGIYASYEPFFEAQQMFQFEDWYANKNSNPRWTWASMSKLYSPDGLELENVDPLNRHNSVVFYPNNQPMAVGNNAERREIAFDGFEIYQQNTTSGCPSNHFVTSIAALVDNKTSHSGQKSLKLTTGAEVVNYDYFVRGTDDPLGSKYECTNCIPGFSPYPGKQYVVSGWVKVNNTDRVSDLDAQVMINYYPSIIGQSVIIRPSGPIIEGWQRFEGKFTMPFLSSRIIVSLHKNPNEITWYDDIRIFPFNGNMKTFVYDPYTLKLMAELDENNYASFYEYDEQGALKRVKKETDNGIMTIKEVRSHQTLK